jgi:cell cycle sensor histidine kinase DivJ
LADDVEPKPDLEVPSAPVATADAAELRPALIQQLIWGMATLSVLAVFLLTTPWIPPVVILALLCAAIPGFAAQFLRRYDGERERAAMVGAWALGGGLAACLTGGAAGPMAIWCLAPFAVAAAFGRRTLAAGGAALSMVALALATWATIAGHTAVPPRAISLWLGVFSVGLFLASLASAFILALGRRAQRDDGARETVQRLETFLAQQPHLVATLDKSGKLTSAFGTAPAGLAVDALFAQGLVSAVHHPDRPALQAALAQAEAKGHGTLGFTPRAALDRWIEIDLKKLDDGRLVAVLRDATVQHARELGLRSGKVEAEALSRGKSRFLANMSHELRTPLNAVIGFSDIMRQRLFGPLSDKYAEYAQLIHESGGHLLDLINDVLDMSKIEAERYELHREVFDAREPVSGALRLVRLQAHEADVALRGLLPAEPILVDADSRALKQIVLNLLSNALKFTPSPGSVTVTLQADGETLEIIVADTGVGLATEDLDRIGRPFEQAGDVGQRARGTGLGLSLVRAFAGLHGGDMTIESALGEGTTVSVRLPVVQVENKPTGGAKIIPMTSQRQHAEMGASH